MASPAKDASAAGAGDMDGAPAAPATVEVASASTIDKLKEMAGVVTSYATKYRDAAPEGSLLTLIKEDLLSAAQELEGTKSAAEDDMDAQSLHVVVQKKTASALVLVAGAVHKAAEYDEEHQVTSSLAKQLSSLYHAVIANLAKLHVGGSSLHGTAESAKTRLQDARSALGEALSKAQDSPVLANAVEMLKDAQQQVTASIAKLEEAPLSEKPVVAGLQALHLAQQALTGATAVAASTADSLIQSSGLDSALTGAKESVANARGQLFALLRSLSAQAGSLLQRAEAAGLSTAVALDKRFGVVDTAASLDAQYGVSTLAAEGYKQGVATVASLDAKYALKDRATAAVEGLRAWDESLTGGTLSGAVQGAVSVAADGVAYAEGLGQKFVEARGEPAQPAKPAVQ